MRIELVTQPDAASSNLFEFLTDLLADRRITRFVAVTAWLNHRGLSRLVPDLRRFRDRLGTTEAIIGIDEGGATEQGLRLAAAEFDRSSVFFTSEDRTFHPKLYFGAGPDAALLFIGSNNLTPGGLFFNFEAAFKVELTPGPLGPTDDQELMAAVGEYIDGLYDDNDVCKALVPNLEDIIRNPGYRVRDEAVPRPRRGTEVMDPDADREAIYRPRLFGRTGRAVKPRIPPGDPIPPSLVGRAVPALPRRAIRLARPATRQAGPSGAPPATPVRRRWFRPLDATAAQHPPDPRSSPTGNLRLTQAGHGIDQTKYFRSEFFAGLVWTADAVPQGMRESAPAVMEVVIDGRNLGLREFVISHAAWREAGQGNVTTVIHLGAIGNELRATNYTGRTITLEQMASGEYRLMIDTAETGPFVR